MRKYLQITEMVQRIVFLNPENSEYSKCMIQLNVIDQKPGAKNIFYVTTHDDEFDDLEKIEPGHYVTILHHADNVLERGEALFIKVSDIYINEEETQRRRTQFDFDEFEDDEGAFHKVINETPYHVSDNTFMLKKS